MRLTANCSQLTVNVPLFRRAVSQSVYSDYTRTWADEIATFSLNAKFLCKDEKTAQGAAAVSDVELFLPHGKLMTVISLELGGYALGSHVSYPVDSKAVNLSDQSQFTVRLDTSDEKEKSVFNFLVLDLTCTVQQQAQKAKK